MPELTDPRAAWESFYMIVGSSGGALIGLQFVVITLLAERRHQATGGALNAFATPTVVHLAGALVISATMSVPWPKREELAVPIGLIGFVGLLYAAIVVVRTLRQTAYDPVWQDWLWYTALPAAVYATLAIVAFKHADAPRPLFVIAACALGLLLIGIHNAWDTVVHIVMSGAGKDRKSH